MIDLPVVVAVVIVVVVARNNIRINVTILFKIILSLQCSFEIGYLLIKM